MQVRTEYTNIRRNVALTATGLLLSAGLAFGQKAELDVNLANPNNEEAKGKIEISGADTTIADPSFEGTANGRIIWMNY